jgi:hypothetical protein
LELQRSAQRLGIDSVIIGRILDENLEKNPNFITDHFDEILDILDRVWSYYNSEKGSDIQNNIHAIMGLEQMEKAQFSLGVNFVRWFLNYLRDSAVVLMHDGTQVKNIDHIMRLEEIKSDIGVLRDILDEWRVQSWKEFREYLDIMRDKVHIIKQEIAKFNAGFQFKKASNDEEEISPRMPEDSSLKSNVVDFVKRKEAWQNLGFSSSWEFVSSQKKQEALREIRKNLTNSENGKEIEISINQDIMAANDEHYPDAEISDDMILRALRSAKLRKDGGMLQSIKNNLVKRAIAKSEKWDSLSTERSIYLADHIQNATVSNPIRIKTAEYEQFDITHAERMEFEWAREPYYKVNVMIKTRESTESKIESLLIHGDRFVVGDFSQKIIWIFTKEGKFIKSNIACTPRDIESHKSNWSEKFVWKVKSSVGKIGNWFSWKK